MDVPFYRPVLTELEINEVVACLRSGWLTTGQRVRAFEQQFSEAVRGQHAVALNSCTAALHLAAEALGLQPQQGVLVPTMTFAATAEIVRYHNAIPILVDCDPITLNMDLADAAYKLDELAKGRLPGIPADTQVVGMIPVHVGGYMQDIDVIQQFAKEHGLWVIEDAAHAFPAAFRRDESSPWIHCGQNTAAVSCFSFYANKTITTGEGGMAVTNDPELAERIRLMSLHGLSRDAWERYSKGGSWDYKIVAPGYKYNLTDIAGALGLGQLARAEEMRLRREEVARIYLDAFQDVEEFELPIEDSNRIHSWHLFPIRLRLDKLGMDRNLFFDALKNEGVACSVHWRPLHLHPYYQESGWSWESCPNASATWNRLISLPLFCDLRPAEILHITDVTKSIAKGKRWSVTGHA